MWRNFMNGIALLLFSTKATKRQFCWNITAGKVGTQAAKRAEAIGWQEINQYDEPRRERERERGYPVI